MQGTEGAGAGKDVSDRGAAQREGLVSCRVLLQNASPSRGRVVCSSSTRMGVRVASLAPMPDLEQQ